MLCTICRIYLTNSWSCYPNSLSSYKQLSTSIDRFLGDAFGVLSCTFWSTVSAVWCSAADTHHKLLDRAVSGALFLIGGVFQCDIAHRRSVAVLCIRCIRSGVTQCTRLMMRYLDHMCTQCPASHRYTYAPPRCRTSQYRKTFVPLSASLWNDLANPVFDGVGLAGFKSRANAILLA